LILLQYIQDVLFRQQVCIVPGIGTFTLQFLPARYNPADRSLEPPGQQVHFDENWTDDGSCLEWISLKENLVPAVAQLKLDKYIAEMKEALATRQPLTLPGIGFLQIDALGHIDFYPENLPGKPDTLHLRPLHHMDVPSPASQEATPAPQPAYTPPPANTPPAAYTPLPEAAQQLYDSLAANHEPVEAAPTREAAEPAPYPPAPWELEEQQSRFKWWWVAVPIAAALLATAIWWFKNNQSAGGGNTTLDTLTVSPTELDTMNMVQEMTPADTATTIPVSENDTIQYKVVFGAYNSYAAAERRVKQLEKCCGVKAGYYSTQDSSVYRLTITFKTPIKDTAEKIKFVRVNYGQNTDVFLTQ
jgi:hypothetical protein